MLEKRRSERLPLNLELNITSLFKQDNIVIDDINEGIEVVNISKTGIGFKCKKALPIDYYFDAKIELTEKKYFYCVLKIVRIEAVDKVFFVGCEFIGLADILSKSVDEYSEEIKK
ncbi:PilZ domain-containing protein [Alkaliphilus peptidifermentans]|uniref:PilZ domain-containing protein n=1 Tax=Alkaliphilus peptidifermentans DSM 18978 TaxID=1120976 RepID=A0A1G5KYA8_9FIRM|nr:PilZ domain-containing protein [Alkaliphilus peptidifermentans]SCZ05334.1 PilZ domain-containing protein [Alkaliphilus peptidifermentans DSM 18978]